MNYKTIHRACSGAALLLGVGHCALAVLAPAFTVDALWFLGTGLAFVILAIVNLCLHHIRETAWTIVLGGLNLGIAAFFASAWTLLPQPQVMVGGVLFGAMAMLVWVGASKRLVGNRN